MSKKRSKTEKATARQEPRATPAPEPVRSSRRWLLPAIAVVIVALAAGAFFTFRGHGLPLPGRSPQPDIILVTIDTLRTDGVSFTGSKKSNTPFLDELARGGIYFQNAHSHNVVTLPSHTNIVTGLLPYQHGVRENAGFVLDPKHKTVAAYLKQRGYATGAFVAAFPLDGRFGLGADFDVYDDEYREGSKPKAYVVPERPATAVVAAAQRWFDSVESKPRFMWVHVYEPHAPYNPPSPYREKYKDKPYYGEVEYVDHVLGEFLRPILEKKRDTMLIVTGDHGEGMSEHGELTHGVFAYEETLHIPLLVYEKGMVEPHVEKSYVRHVDIVPTILERVGIAQPKEMTGSSLLRIDKPRDTYFEALTANINLGWAPLVGMIHDGHKYIDVPLPELYNLPADPLEKKNIFKDDRRMTNRIRELLAAQAPAPGPVERNLSMEEQKKLISLGYLVGTAAQKKVYTERDDPKNIIHLYMRMMDAIGEYQKGDMAAAIAISKKLIAERPEMSMARDFLAFLLQENQDEGEAEALIRQAIANGTANDAIRKRLGMILSESGRAEEAVKVLQPFADSRDPDLLNAYGIALADLGRYPDAVREFQRALQVDETNATAYQNLGVVALRTGDLPRAEQFLSHALQLNDEMPLALNTMGVVYARRNDMPRALQSWQRAVKLDPKQYDALFNIGLVAGTAGRYEESRRALEQFVKTAPKDRYAHDIATAQGALRALR